MTKQIIIINESYERAKLLILLSLDEMHHVPQKPVS